MDQSHLKTSPKQRILISVIAIIMIASMIASYALIILNNKDTSSSKNNSIDPATLARYESEYSAATETLSATSAPYFNEFISFKSHITAYNEASANAAGVTFTDLKSGTGRELKDGDSDYYAYYAGWCADESIFDSSFDDKTNPTAFSSVLDASAGLIEGWNLGVVGMRLGGIREVTIPGELAYGESKEICGGKNKPLKFIIMALEKSEPLASVAAAYNLAKEKLQYANYGLDYDSIMSNNSSNADSSADTSTDSSADASDTDSGDTSASDASNPDEAN